MTDDADAGQNPSRNELAEDRTILANERTFASWMRTSLACVAVGMGFQRLFPSIEPTWVPRAIATGFLLLAVLVVGLAQRRAAAVLRRLSAHTVVTAKAMNLGLFAALLSLGAVALTVTIWTVDIN
jgi:putative membrane protein